MKLTKREREILPLLCLSYKQMSNKLNISEGTVRTHISNIMFKFPDQENRFSVVLEALKIGLINLDEIITR